MATAEASSPSAATAAAPVEDGASMTADDDAPSLVIPITSSSTSKPGMFIEIFPEEMGETPAPTLLQVLKDEGADLDVWADAGLMYMQQKLARDSLTLLKEACEMPCPDQTKKVRLLAATGIAHLASQQRNKGAGKFFWPGRWFVVTQSDCSGDI